MPHNEHMVQPFIFEADGHTFACGIERRASRLAPLWWWFSVSGESHRFAPFQPAADDTLETVRFRILSYYRELVATRDTPTDWRESLERRRKNLAALKSMGYR